MLHPILYLTPLGLLSLLINTMACVVPFPITTTTATTMPTAFSIVESSNLNETTDRLVFCHFMVSTSYRGTNIISWTPITNNAIETCD